MLIIQPFFKFCKWFSKEYISSQVSYQANEFLESSLFSKLSHTERYKIKVKWVTKPDDPLLNQNGTLLLRLKEEDDQTRNILSAVNAALPHVLCPLIRKNINSTCERSIDLTILKKLSEKLGNHGKLTFKRYFLDPETDIDIRINDLIRKLVTLDENGFFIPIFINELEYLSEGIYANNDVTDYSESILHFVEYLLTIVNREVGAEIELEYLVSPFKVSSILLARAQRADSQGLRPYLRRLDINLDKGSESIYIIAFPPAFDFFDRLTKYLESHERIFIKKLIKTNLVFDKKIKNSNLRIAVLVRNDIFTDEEFETRINTNQIIEGSILDGIVEDVSQDITMVTTMGMRAYIDRYDCCWHSISHCNEIFNVGEQHRFVVKKIIKSTSQIFLSRRFHNENPWDSIDIPMKNSIIDVNVVSIDTIKFTCHYLNLVDVYILLDEVSWYFLTPNQLNQYLGKSIKVKVLEVNGEEEKIFCSIRQVDSNPWIDIHKSLPIGKFFNGKVVEVTSEFILVRLPNNFLGQIPKYNLEKAGYEYAKYQDNIVVGQGIDVVVTKVFIDKKKIRLDLVRNMGN